jgi:hypothetical protein
MERRFELVMNADMRRAIEKVAARKGLHRSAWARMIFAQALTDELGESWLDHPQSDSPDGSSASVTEVTKIVHRLR